jgi:hypothetical protein
MPTASCDKIVGISGGWPYPAFGAIDRTQRVFGGYFDPFMKPFRRWRD